MSLAKIEVVEQRRVSWIAEYIKVTYVTDALALGPLLSRQPLVVDLIKRPEAEQSLVRFSRKPRLLIDTTQALPVAAEALIQRLAEVQLILYLPVLLKIVPRPLSAIAIEAELQQRLEEPVKENDHEQINEEGYRVIDAFAKIKVVVFAWAHVVSIHQRFHLVEEDLSIAQLPVAEYDHEDGRWSHEIQRHICQRVAE